MAFQNRVDVDRKRNLLDRLRGRSPATQGTSATPSAGRSNRPLVQPGVAQPFEHTQNLFGDLTPEAQAGVLEERERYAAAQSGELFESQLREEQVPEATGLMGEIEDAINWMMSALELSSGLDHFLGTDVRGFKKNQTEKSLVHAFTGEVIDGALSLVSLAEIAFTLGVSSPKAKAAIMLGSPVVIISQKQNLY